MSEDARPYVGQPGKYESDPWSAWHDYSKPDESSKTNVHEDQNPDRPTGSTTTKGPVRRIVRWYKDRK